MLSALSLGHTEKKLNEANGVKNAKTTAFKASIYDTVFEAHVIVFSDENSLKGKLRYWRISTF